jgi:hypothetical protein
VARVGDSDAAGSDRPIARAAGSDRESGTRREARIDSALGEIPPDIFGQAFAVDISARTRGGRRARGVSAARAAAAAVKAERSNARASRRAARRSALESHRRGLQPKTRASVRSFHVKRLALCPPYDPYVDDTAVRGGGLWQDLEEAALQRSKVLTLTLTLTLTSNWSASNSAARNWMSASAARGLKVWRGRCPAHQVARLSRGQHIPGLCSYPEGRHPCHACSVLWISLERARVRLYLHVHVHVHVHVRCMSHARLFSATTEHPLTASHEARLLARGSDRYIR